MNDTEPTTAHTPLPWAWSPSGSTMAGYSQSFGILGPLPTLTNLIAGIFNDGIGGQPVAEANARYIVTACNAHPALIRERDALLLALQCAEDVSKASYTSDGMENYYYQKWKPYMEPYRTQWGAGLTRMHYLNYLAKELRSEALAMVGGEGGTI